MQKINSLHSFQTATSEMSNVIPLFTKLSYQRQKGGGGVVGRLWASKHFHLQVQANQRDVKQSKTIRQNIRYPQLQLLCTGTPGRD